MTASLCRQVPQFRQCYGSSKIRPASYPVAASAGLINFKVKHQYQYRKNLEYNPEIKDRASREHLDYYSLGEYRTQAFYRSASRGAKKRSYQYYPE